MRSFLAAFHELIIMGPIAFIRIFYCRTDCKEESIYDRESTER